MLMALAWILLNDKTLWTQYMIGKYLNRDGDWPDNKSSSIWNRIKWALKEIKEKYE